MAQHFSMGAMNKTTNTYEYPTIADKKNKYECPECKKDVIFKKGTIIRPYFAHKKSNSPCYYYEKPNEAQIHKDAKLLLKSLLDNKKILYFYRSCPYCYNDKFERIHYNENMKAVIEHRFNYNNSNKSADVALLENNEIKFIFEICYKNKTKEENRPEPWFEIDAEDLINGMNTGEIIDEENEINIKCIRYYKCYWCKLKEEKENERRIQKKIESERSIIEENERRIKERIERERLIKEEKERKDIKEKKRLEKEKERFNEETETLNMYKEDERTILEEKEVERQRKEYLQNKKLKTKCKCGLQLIDLCNCKIPKFELNKLSNNYICKNNNCKKWKCRCIVSQELTTNENDLHKKAKYKLASWLKDKIPIYISWTCCKSRYDGKICNTSDDDTNCNIEYDVNDEVIIEYKDIDNKYIADIALINNGKIKYIFEIKCSNTTIFNVRPEPWFEISTKDILNVNMNEEIMLICLRNNKNRYCNDCRILEEDWVNNLPRLPNRKGSSDKWRQDLECIKCGRDKYSPIFVKGYRQICKLCLVRDKEELRKEYTSKCLIKIKKSI